MFWLNMKTAMFQNRRVKKKYLAIILSGLAVLFLFFYFLGGFPPPFVEKGFFFMSQPLVSLKSKVLDVFERNIVLFLSKKELQAENIFLKQRVSELEATGELSKFFEEENLEIKESFSYDKRRGLMISSILLRPGYGIYNSLIIDSGSDEGVENGMSAIAFGNVFLGYVFETTSSTGKVKLISFPGEETNVFVGNKISAIAVGLGGENLEIVLPHNVDVRKGDIITTLDTNPLYLGTVSEIKRDLADPFQRIIFRLPVNIQELRYVFLVKNEK
jgi:rod shape-determining protein MreC